MFTLATEFSILSAVLLTLLETDSIAWLMLLKTPILILGTRFILGSLKLVKAFTILAFSFVFNVLNEPLILTIAFLIRTDALTKGEAIATNPFFSLSSNFILGNLKLDIALFSLLIESVDKELNESLIPLIELLIVVEACSIIGAIAFIPDSIVLNMLKSISGISWISGICIFSKLFFILPINPSILSSTYLNPFSMPSAKPCVKN